MRTQAGLPILIALKARVFHLLPQRLTHLSIPLLLLNPDRNAAGPGSGRYSLDCFTIDVGVFVQTKKAVVLLSGGLDSATILAIAQSQGFEVSALSFAYGQRHSWELEAARQVAQAAGVANHRIATIDLRVFGGSALTDDIAVPKGRGSDEMEHGIPITYVPARNTIFLSFALAWVEVLESSDIFIGVNALDYSGYPDCRPEFIEAFEKMANLATKAGVEGHQNLKVHAPLIALSKAQIIRRGMELGVNYSLTSSCYDPALDGAPCGQCDSCFLRQKGFRENGLEDPLTYQGTSNRVSE